MAFAPGCLGEQLGMRNGCFSGVKTPGFGCGVLGCNHQGFYVGSWGANTASSTVALGAWVGGWRGPIAPNILNFLKSAGPWLHQLLRAAALGGP